MPILRPSFKQIVASIAKGTYKKDTLDLSNMNLTDENIKDLMLAIESPNAKTFKQNLTTLNLSNREGYRLNSFSAITIEEFPNLMTIDLSEVGRIHSTLKIKLSKLPKLKTIKATNSDIISFETYSLPNVEHIDLSNNQLTSFNVAQFPLLKDLNLKGNRISIFDLSGLKHLETADIRPVNGLVIDAVAVTTVYIGAGTKFSKYLGYDSDMFDPITINIFNKQRTLHPSKFLDDNGDHTEVDFNISDIQDYLTQMLKLYKNTWGPVDLQNAAENYLRWLFNPQISKNSEDKYYHIEPQKNYDVHVEIIAQLFLDGVQKRINELYGQINRAWSKEDSKYLQKLAKEYTDAILMQAKKSLQINPVLKSQMRRMSAKFNAMQDKLKFETEHGVSKSTQIVAALEPKAVKKSMLNKYVGKQISYISSKILGNKPTKKRPDLNQ